MMDAVTAKLDISVNLCPLEFLKVLTIFVCVHVLLHINFISCEHNETNGSRLGAQITNSCFH